MKYIYLVFLLFSPTSCPLEVMKTIVQIHTLWGGVIELVIPIETEAKKKQLETLQAVRRKGHFVASQL